VPWRRASSLLRLWEAFLVWFEATDVKVVKGAWMNWMSVDGCGVGRDGCCVDSWEEGRKGCKKVGDLLLKYAKIRQAFSE
jgi:hypothetical protein